MQAESVLPRLNLEDPSSRFLGELVEKYGVKSKRDWHNNNSTLSQNAYILDIDKLQTVSHIFQELSKFNSQHEGRPLVAVPVAGWDEITTPRRRIFSCLSTEGRQERIITEYAKSFSLSPWTTAKNADIVLRLAKKIQNMSVFKIGKESFLRVSAGVRITDADEFLDKQGLALPPNMPTLHVASLVGACANGCYGPARDYGPMTTNIVEMKVIDPQGKQLTLSTSENPELFAVLRDCHMGSGFFVSEITLANIQPKFRMSRHSVLLKDAAAFKANMLEKNKLGEEHFMAMYIPIDMASQDAHFPRIRMTTMNRTDENPTEATQTKEQHNLTDYLNLMITEVGEPLIDLVVKSKELRHFFPFVLKAAAAKTYGKVQNTLEIDWSPNILHIFRTYTDLPLCDINWLIQVETADDARNLLVALFELTENRLNELAAINEFPLFNAFSRFLKGICYKDGEGGVTATATEKETQSILSFELLTYSALENTPEFKILVADVIELLTNGGYKFKYHPGKTWPEHVNTLSQLFNDAVGKKKLENFQAAITQLHGANLKNSPLLTAEKKAFLALPVESNHKMYGSFPVSPLKLAHLPRELTLEEKKAALNMIVKLAEEHSEPMIQAEAIQILGKK
jgi:hypothetical protein